MHQTSRQAPASATKSGPAFDSKNSITKQPKAQAALVLDVHSPSQEFNASKEVADSAPFWSTSSSSGLARQADSNIEDGSSEDDNSGTADRSECGRPALVKSQASRKASMVSAGSNIGLAPEIRGNDNDINTNIAAPVNEGQALPTAGKFLPEQQTDKALAKPAAPLEAAAAVASALVTKSDMPAQELSTMPARNTCDISNKQSLPAPEALLMVQRLPAVLSKSLPTAESLGLQLRMPRGAKMLSKACAGTPACECCATVACKYGLAHSCFPLQPLTNAIGGVVTCFCMLPLYKRTQLVL